MAIDTARATPVVDTTGDTTKGARVVAPPPKLRRRPALVAASIALICLGGVLAAFAWTATSATRAVVAVRDEVQRGQVIEAGDLMTVQVSVDPALRTVPAAQLATLVGRRAATDLAAGTLLTANQVTDQTLPSSGQSLVGVALPPGQLPGEELVAGDRVRVVFAGRGHTPLICRPEMCLHTNHRTEPSPCSESRDSTPTESAPHRSFGGLPGARRLCRARGGCALCERCRKRDLRMTDPGSRIALRGIGRGTRTGATSASPSSVESGQSPPT